MTDSQNDLTKPTLVCVVVYNRLHNLKHWLSCWQQCEHDGAELIVIHNTDKDQPDYAKACLEHGVRYLARPNVGYDIGAFQDVCAGRLKGFPRWERLLWFTDDTFPMCKDFVSQFQNVMTPGVGVACMEISPYVRTHIRTTGFMLDRSTAQRLTFPRDPILTKQECYLFEHKAKGGTFYDQVERMGLRSTMVTSRRLSPTWDTGYTRRLDRLKEHQKLFGEIGIPDKVLIICPVYQDDPRVLVASLLAQTHRNWELKLIHDGPDVKDLGNHYANIDGRITFTATSKRGGCWGHYIRQVAIDHYAGDFDYVLVTNGDNYHVPVFLERLLKGFEQHPRAVATYCAEMVHSYKAWDVIPCRPEQGFMDCAGVLVKASVAKGVGWQDITSHSADWVYFHDIILSHGVHNFVKVRGCLLIHN
jgi:Glycosyl transferase family 2